MSCYFICELFESGFVYLQDHQGSQVVEVIQDHPVRLDPQELQVVLVLQAVPAFKASQDNPEVQVFQDRPDLLDPLEPQVRHGVIQLIL